MPHGNDVKRMPVETWCCDCAAENEMPLAEEPITVKRRKLDLRNGDEVIAEINSLRQSGYSKAKNWNLTQVCQHLSATMNGGMDGFGFRLPWILRATIVKWVFAYALKSRKLLSGAPTFPVLKPKCDSHQDDDALIDECIESIKRAQTFTGSLEDYAMLDNLSHEDWRDFMWIHAAHHLSFLIPTQVA